MESKFILYSSTFLLFFGVAVTAQQIVREITPSIFIGLTFTGDNYGGGSGYGFGLDQRAAEDFETDLFFYDEDPVGDEGPDGVRSANEDVWQNTGTVSEEYDAGDDLFDIGTDSTQNVSFGDMGSFLRFDVPAPASPFLKGFASFEKDFADPNVVKTDLAIDARPFAASVTWELVVDFGFPSGADSSDITVAWDTATVDAAKTSQGFNTAKILRKSDNSELVADMATTDALLLTGSTGGSTTLLIVFANDNIALIARNDTIIAFSSASPAAIDVDVLANDFDPNAGETITITGVNVPSGNGSATFTGSTISYTPPVNFVSTLGDASTYKTFTYTIQDNAGTPATATGTVTVIGSDSAIIATRDHADLAKAGTDADAGLTVTVEITYSGSPTQITLTETFPSFDQTDNFYEIAAGTTGTELLDISVTNAPNSVTGNGSNTAVVFTWTVVPTNPFSFTYRLVGDVVGPAEKTITGTIDQDGTTTNVVNKNDLTKGFTTFTPTNIVATIAATDSDGDEDGADPATFTVTLTPAPTENVDVSYSFTGTADTTENVDYTALSGTVTVGTSGTATITIAPINDALVEGPETVILMLQPAADNEPYFVGDSPNDMATVTITDADAATVAFQNGTTTVGEDDAAATDITLVLTTTVGNTLENNASVTVSATNGTAVDADYDAGAGAKTVTFTATLGNTATQTVSFDAASDTLVEGDQTVTLEVVNGALLTGNGQTSNVITITDVDSATVEFASGSSKVLEDDPPHTLTVNLVISAGVTLQDDAVIVVNDAMTGRATPGIDYTLTTTSVTFTAGSGNGDTKDVAVTQSSDDLVEGNEDVDLALAVTSGAATVGTQSTHEVTIIDFILSLGEGWNLISLPINPDQTIGNILGDVLVGNIWGWENNGDQSFLTAKGKSENLAALCGYWILARKSTNKSFPGQPRINVNRNKELQIGWNLFGPAIDIDNPYNAQINDTIWYWDGKRFKPVGRDAGQLEVGKGYWINSMSTQSYPSPSGL